MKAHLTDRADDVCRLRVRILLGTQTRLGGRFCPDVDLNSNRELTMAGLQDYISFRLLVGLAPFTVEVEMHPMSSKMEYCPPLTRDYIVQQRVR